MSNNVLQYVISLKDKMSPTLNRVRGRLNGFRSSVNNAFKHPIQSIMKFKGAILGLVGAFAVVGVAIKKAFQFESLTVQFAVLFKDLEKAKKHMEELKSFSGSTPFQLDDIAKASRSLNVFTDGVLGSVASLYQIGDAAAATGNSIKDLSFWVGRAYSSISMGRPFGEAAMRLQEMGILSGQARSQMEDLQKAGASNAEIWGVLTTAMEKYEGGMKTLSETGDGLMSTMQDNWTLALATFGEAFSDSAKGGISEIIEILQKLRSDGSIAEWAERAVQTLSGLMNKLKKTKDGLAWLYTHTGAKEVVDLGRKTYKGVTAYAGVSAGQIERSFNALKDGGMKGFAESNSLDQLKKDAGSVWSAFNETDEKALAEQNDKKAADAKAKAQAKVEKEKADATEKLASEAKRYGVEFADGMTDTDKQKAVSKARVAADLKEKSAEKAWKDWQKENIEKTKKAADAKAKADAKAETDKIKAEKKAKADQQRKIEAEASAKNAIGLYRYDKASTEKQSKYLESILNRGNKLYKEGKLSPEKIEKLVGLWRERDRIKDVLASDKASESDLTERAKGNAVKSRTSFNMSTPEYFDWMRMTNSERAAQHRSPEESTAENTRRANELLVDIKNKLEPIE